VERVRSWPVLKDPDEVGTFLDFTGYYLQFVKNYANTVHPLNEVSQEVVGRYKSRSRKSPGQPTMLPINFNQHDKKLLINLSYR